ncbi:hypothetical protein D3C79_926500 [compost metagenome]
MHHHVGVFQAQQLLGPLGGGLGNYNGHRHTQLAPRIRYCQAGVAARGRNELLGATGLMHFAGVADAAQLERAARLQGIELEPDVSARSQRYGTRFDQGGVDMQGHWVVPRNCTR